MPRASGTGRDQGIGHILAAGTAARSKSSGDLSGQVLQTMDRQVDRILNRSLDLLGEEAYAADGGKW